MVAKRKKATRRRKNVNPDPVFDGCEALSGAEFLKKQRHAVDYYRTEYKSKDLYSDWHKWLANNGYTKQQISHIKKYNKDTGVVSIYARCLNTGMIDFHEDAAKVWAALPGTIGDLRPTSEFLHSTAKRLLERTDEVELDDEEAEAAKKKEAAKKPNIQDHLREKMYETLGELEDLWDSFLAGDSKVKPFNVIHNSNLGPQFINYIIQRWDDVRLELVELQAGTCDQLNEGYSHWGKIQVRNNIRFCEQVISDCNSYLQLKKANRTPRKRKPVSPEKLTRGFKYLKEDTALDIKSSKVTDLVDAGEGWLFNVKTRKLIHVVADSYTKTFTVKGSSIIGLDSTQSVQKTLRKPAEQLKEFMKLSVPNKRKWFKDIKSVEIKFNGRGNDNLLLLNIR